MRRLSTQAAHRRFTIESVTWRRPRQDAPDVVIESNNYTAVAHALPQIVDAIDPPPHSNRKAYEGIFVEAVDSLGVPYVAISDSLRHTLSGSQWARADDLYPYAHG